MTTTRAAIMTVLSAAMMLLSACGGVVDKIEATADCNNICERYQECVSSDHDVDQCTNECVDKSEADADYRRQANECEACLDNRACSENIPCIDECFGVIE